MGCPRGRRGGRGGGGPGGRGGEATSGLITTERGREKAVLLKPQEFMNLSGFAVSRAAQFYAVEPDHILVVHDEIDLDFGIVRLKNGGGHGGTTACARSWSSSASRT